MKTTTGLKEMILVSMFAALTAIFAQITIPLPISPVPVTLQVLAVCLAAAILGSRLSTLSHLIYIAVGIIGMPVFSGATAGFAQIMGPTGGYIIGFPVSSFITGKIVEKRHLPTLPVTLLAMLSGLIVIYAFGMLHLSLITGVNLKTAFITGVVPFIGMDTVKIILGAAVARSVRTILIKQGLLKIPG